MTGQITDTKSSLQSLLNALLAFAQSSACQAVSPAIQKLSQALAQQVRLALRDTYPAHPDQQGEENNEQHSEKGEQNHV